MRPLKNFAAGFLLMFLASCQDGCDPPYCGDTDCDRTQGESESSCPTDCGGDVPGGYCDSPASATGAELDMWLMQQWCDQWCWSAVITNVANYYGKSADGFGPVQECQLASYRLGDPSLSVCCQYAACAYQACNSPGSFEQMVQIMQALGLTGQLLPRPLSEAEIQREITNGRPIIMAIQSSSSGHVTILSGYARQGGQAIYRVDDPWPYNSWGVPSQGGAGTRYFLTYQQLLVGSTTGQSLWVATFTRLSPRADGCSPRTNPSCTCGDGAGPDAGPGGACGDGNCDLAVEDPIGCPADCGVCGDGACTQAESLLGTCPPDCGGVVTCDDPNYPTDCGDGTGCWSPGTNCASHVFSCGGVSRRCNVTTDTFSCCDGAPVTCPSTHPYFCPTDGLCHSAPPNCGTSSCTVVNGDC